MRAARRLQGKLIAQVADHADRQLVLVFGLAGLDEIGVRARLDLQAAGARPARIELDVRARLAQKRLRQLASEGALADPFGAHEQEGMRQSPLAQAAFSAIRRPGHGRGRSARTRSTSLLNRSNTVSGSLDASIRTIGAG